MSRDSLTPFQRRLLALLADIRPRWRLTGGGALAGFHAGHRETRDLDLFWPQVEHFDEVVAEVGRALSEAGLSVGHVQNARTFARRVVSDGAESCIIDLVSDSTVIVDPPIEMRVEGVVVLVDSAQEILTNKLCALLSRSELRDLVDTKWLVEHGADFRRAVLQAQAKDSGFSAAVLAWVLHGSNIDAMGSAAGADPGTVDELRRWRDQLVERLVAMSAP